MTEKYLLAVRYSSYEHSLTEFNSLQDAVSAYNATTYADYKYLAKVLAEPTLCIEEIDIPFTGKPIC